MKSSRFIVGLFFSFAALFGLFSPCISYAQGAPAVKDPYGLETTASRSGLLKANTPKDVPTIAGNIIGTALSMISVIFFILMVYGGFLWMTAHGDESQVTKAQETIIGAVIGIIVILASYAITNYVTTSVISNSPAAPAPAGQNPAAAP